jgi:hypothetical protein
MAYTTVGDVKQYLGISESTDDALIGTLIDAAQQAIDTYCRRTFEASADSTRYFDYSPQCIQGPDLWLDEDLCAITSVTNGDSVVVASTERTTVPRNETPYFKIRLLSDSGVTWTYDDEWMDAIKVIGKWAYSEEAPNDIAQACKRLASFYYRGKDAPLTDVTAIEAGVVIRTPDIPADVRAILKPYVKP